VRWSAANPFAALKKLTQLKGVGLLVGVLACTGLAQFTLYTIWVLYATYRFGWGPAENGWSLFAVGVVSAVTQGVLLSRLLKAFGRERLALWGMASSATAYLAWGLSTEPWMMYAVIALNVLGGTVAATLQGIVSAAADPRQQGETMGAVSGLSSLMAVIGPMLASPLMGMVSHLPKSDWRVGTPFFFGAALLALAWLFAWLHFRRPAPAVAPSSP
jgi:MFS transporter, DHA1 family, tetracycline resistance protein